MTRIDGRQADELRSVTITPGFLRGIPGNALIECGGTRVLCTAICQEGVPPFLAGKGRGWLTAEYSMLPASTKTRKKRDAGRPDGRGVEIQRIIGRCLRAVCDFDALGEMCVYVDCDVLEADGGTRTASITGAYAALRLLERDLLARGAIQKGFINEQIAAVSCGIVDGRALLDLCYEEDSRAGADGNFAMTASGKIVEAQATDEGHDFTKAELISLIDMAEKGVGELFLLQRRALGEAE